MYKDMPTPQLSLVIPCCNEAHTIRGFVESWESGLRQESISYEILLINDGSEDGSGRVLDTLRQESGSIRVIHQLKKGFEETIRRAFQICRGEYVLLMNTESRYEFSDFLRMWVERESRDLILGVRVHRLDSLKNRIFSYCLRFILNLLFSSKLKDANTPFRLFRRKTGLHLIQTRPTLKLSFNVVLALLLEATTSKRLLCINVPYRQNSIEGIPKPESSFGRAMGYLQELLSLYWEGLSPLPAYPLQLPLES